MIKIIFSYYKKLLFITILIFIFGSYANSQSYTVPLPETPEFEYLGISVIYPKLIGSTTIITPMVYLWPEFEQSIQPPMLNRKVIRILAKVKGKKYILQADINNSCYSNPCEICIQNVDEFALQLMLLAKTRNGWIIEKGSVSVNRTNINAPSGRTTQMSIPISKIFEITDRDVTYLFRIRFKIAKQNWWTQATETPLNFF